MADWRDDERGRRSYMSDRSEGRRPRGDLGDHERDVGGRNYEEGYGRERSAYPNWGRPDDAREYDDYARARGGSRYGERGGYGYDRGGTYDRNRGAQGRYGADYESGRYSSDYGERQDRHSDPSRPYGPSGGYPYGLDERRGGRARLDGLRGMRNSGYDFESDDQRSDAGYRSDRDRGWMERAGDEVRAWFGDDDAERRRRQDRHRGLGPKGYTRSDERIREDVCDRLSDDWRIDASDIEVQVNDGEVTLSGTVSDRLLKRRAEDVAEDISGVQNVQNNLRVQTARSVGASSGFTNPGGDTAALSSGMARGASQQSGTGSSADTGATSGTSKA